MTLVGFVASAAPGRGQVVPAGCCIPLKWQKWLSACYCIPPSILCCSEIPLQTPVNCAFIPSTGLSCSGSSCFMQRATRASLFVAQCAMLRLPVKTTNSPELGAGCALRRLNVVDCDAVSQHCRFSATCVFALQPKLQPSKRGVIPLIFMAPPRATVYTALRWLKAGQQAGLIGGPAAAPCSLFRRRLSASVEDVAQNLAASRDSGDQQGADPLAQGQRPSDADPGSLFAAGQQRRAEADLEEIMSKPAQPPPQVPQHRQCCLLASQLSSAFKQPCESII